jgi:hypothetical protein
LLIEEQSCRGCPAMAWATTSSAPPLPYISAVSIKREAELDAEL